MREPFWYYLLLPAIPALVYAAGWLFFRVQKVIDFAKKFWYNTFKRER